MKYFLSILALMVMVGCATKDFGQLHPLTPQEVDAMSCSELEQEFRKLNLYEDGVDEEASTGQAQQIFWGGIWSVMADDKLENIARKDIRDRVRMLYDAKSKKRC